MAAVVALLAHWPTVVAHAHLLVLHLQAGKFELQAAVVIHAAFVGAAIAVARGKQPLFLS